MADDGVDEGGEVGGVTVHREDGVGHHHRRRFGIAAHSLGDQPRPVGGELDGDQLEASDTLESVRVDDVLVREGEVTGVVVSTGSTDESGSTDERGAS